METEFIVRVHDLARGGAGVSRDSSGRVLFIAYAAPGDLVKVRVTQNDKRYAHAEIIEILEASPSRQTPPCPVFGRCGGCQWQHLSYEIQWETKVKGVSQVLQKMGIACPPLEELPATQVWEYRNRVQLRGSQNQLGYYQAKTRDLVPVNRCDIARAEINESWEEIRQEGAELEVPFKVEVEVTRQGKIKKNWNSPHASGGFRQVHDGQNEKLKAWIFKELQSGPKIDVLYDLFGGEGNLSLPFVEHIPEIHCVDLSSPRVRPIDTPQNLHFHHSAVHTWLSKNRASFTQKNHPRSAAILDPPREGLSNLLTPIAEALEERNVTCVVLVGCDLDAWGKDVKGWISRHWKVQKVMVLDLFPQTIHVESVAVLTRENS